MNRVISTPLLECRACGGKILRPLINLGEQHLTGRFLKPDDEDPPVGPLDLVICESDQHSKGCGLLQLSHLYNPSEMYGAEYGYASSVTSTMQEHLYDLAGYVAGWARLEESDAVLDIGSNDGTLLSAMATQCGFPVGVDPSAAQFADRYPDNAQLIVDFFSAEAVRNALSADQKFKIITSIAMFYDIDTPLKFMQEIKELLSPNGVWLTEQSHARAMYERLCYDSICHEHATYLTLHAMIEMGKKAGLRPLDVRSNNINGGSFSVLFCRADSSRHQPNSFSLNRMLTYENDHHLNNFEGWASFSDKVMAHRERLRNFLITAKEQGRKVLGYGASTKGNVLLQYCGITPELLPAIAERDPRKFGKVTPGTRIPIISEAEARAMGVDVFIVFPWHFRDEIIQREQAFLASGKTLLFPLPEFILVTS
ncbi:Methyltransferase domain-containing protein [Maridesulfovibrio ferrireducens]|uniref:Methyltransferase domain-containing protein n=1 Tax=Maridesulfovibrio ferrireducens TaxID=246191 RepID=A0A1G9ETN6_9BACT|nr:class I SAM-dependent methyltransferase [Maridesulfovibrio ferrireducens]SDK79453.1 Methyltransferase domain-containing protein [Maridesulfovibrio ferrireducens]